MAALVSQNIDLPTSLGQTDVQCLQVNINKHRHQNCVLSPEDLSWALNLGADIPTLPNFSLFVKNHLAGWPESSLGKRRECLAAASSTSESEIPPASSPASGKRRHLHTASCNFSLVPPPAPKTLFITSPVKYRQGKPLRPEQQFHSLAQSSSPRTGTRGDQICLLPPKESSCRHNTPVNHAVGGRLPREALLGESPNKAVRSHPHTYLLDQHFQNHRREPKERSRGGTETGGWRETASPRLVLDAWAVPGGAGKGASSLAASGCKGSSLPRSSGARNKRGVGGRSCTHRGSGAASPAALGPRPDSHLPRRDPGPDPWGCGGGGCATRREAAAGGGERQPGLQRPSRGRSHACTALVPLPRTGRRCCCGGLRAPLWLC